MNYFYKGGRELPIGKKSSFTYGIRSMILEIARLKLYSLLLGVSMLHMFSLSAQTPRKDSGAGGQYFLKGTVVSAIDDKALQGVSVRLEAEDKRVSTNKDGSFELMVTQPTGKVKFTFIGYNTVESSYSVAVPMRIYLVPKDNQLDEVEVVSTGYQKIPKERATGSFEFVDNKLLNRKVSTDFVSRLQDVVPGISIFDKGQRETKGFLMRMNVRGQSSLTAASPLIVVDGVPYESKLADYGLGEFNNINPNDIESISVLKDASAASIWGAQSGNGVIVITTKKGKFNARPKIAFNSNISIKNKPDLFYYPQMTAKDYIDLTQILFDKGRYDSYFNDLYYNPLDIVWSMKDQRDGIISKAELEEQKDELGRQDQRNDFLKYIYRKAINRQINVQISGGGDKANTLFSIGYDGNNNELVTSSYNRMVLRSASQFKPVKNLLLDVSMTYTRSKSVDSWDFVGYNILGKGVENPPYLRLADQQGIPLAYDISGFNRIYRDTLANGRLQSFDYTPLNEINESKVTQKLHEILANFSASYSLNFGLKLHALYSYQNTQNPIESWRGIGSYYLRSMLNDYASWDDKQVTWNLPVGEQLITNNWDSHIHHGRLNMEYNKIWNLKNEINLLAGYDVRQLQKNLTVSQYYGYDTETGTFKSTAFGKEVPYLNGMFGTYALPDDGRIEALTNRYLSYYANGSYSYDQKYIVSASFRKDASNLFGVKANDRGQPFWSTGLAWLISKEDFLNSRLIDMLKIRTTYGYNGNVNNSVAAYPIISVQSAVNSITGQNYAIMSTPPNPKLRWERIANLNFGVDFGLFKHRLNGSVEYYQKWGKDLISVAPVDPTLGYSTLTVNYANTKTTGWDISLQAKSVESKDWGWQHNLVFSYNKTLVTKAYANPSNPSYLYMAGNNSSPMTPVEGADLYALLSYSWAGLDPEDGSPRAYLNGEISKDYLAIRNSKLDHLQNNGSTRPLYFGSLRNTVRFKNVELSFNIAFQLGHKFLRSSFSNSYFIDRYIGHSDYALRWQKPGDELTTNVPSFAYPNSSLASEVYMQSSALVENAGQIKLRDIQCSVQIPYLSHYGLKDCRLYGYFQNIGTLWRANKKGIDPEFGNSYTDPLMCSLGINFNL